MPPRGRANDPRSSVLPTGAAADDAPPHWVTTVFPPPILPDVTINGLPVEPWTAARYDAPKGYAPSAWPPKPGSTTRSTLQLSEGPSSPAKTLSKASTHIPELVEERADTPPGPLEAGGQVPAGAARAPPARPCAPARGARTAARSPRTLRAQPAGHAAWLAARRAATVGAADFPLGLREIPTGRLGALRPRAHPAPRAGRASFQAPGSPCAPRRTERPPDEPRAPRLAKVFAPAPRIGKHGAVAAPRTKYGAAARRLLPYANAYAGARAGGERVQAPAGPAE